MAHDIIVIAQKQYNCSCLHDATAQHRGTWGSIHRNNTNFYLHLCHCQRILKTNINTVLFLESLIKNFFSITINVLLLFCEMYVITSGDPGNTV